MRTEQAERSASEGKLPVVGVARVGSLGLVETGIVVVIVGVCMFVSSQSDQVKRMTRMDCCAALNRKN